MCINMQLYLNKRNKKRERENKNKPALPQSPQQAQVAPMTQLPRPTFFPLGSTSAPPFGPLAAQLCARAAQAQQAAPRCSPSPFPYARCSPVPCCVALPAHRARSGSRDSAQPCQAMAHSPVARPVHLPEPPLFATTCWLQSNPRLGGVVPFLSALPVRPRHHCVMSGCRRVSKGPWSSSLQQARRAGNNRPPFPGSSPARSQPRPIVPPATPPRPERSAPLPLPQ
jgi:hypothetical protein